MDRTGQITRLRPSAVPTQFKFSSQVSSKPVFKKEPCVYCMAELYEGTVSGRGEGEGEGEIERGREK